MILNLTLHFWTQYVGMGRKMTKICLFSRNQNLDFEFYFTTHFVLRASVLKNFTDWSLFEIIYILSSIYLCKIPINIAECVKFVKCEYFIHCLHLLQRMHSDAGFRAPVHQPKTRIQKIFLSYFFKKCPQISHNIQYKINKNSLLYMI